MSSSFPSSLPETIHPDGADALEGAGWLDVREPFELEICSLPDAQHIPLGELPSRTDELTSAAPLIVFCHHGVRSLQAVRYLRAAGYPLAVNLEGGIDRWARERAPDMARY